MSSPLNFTLTIPPGMYLTPISFTNSLNPSTTNLLNTISQLSINQSTFNSTSSPLRNTVSGWNDCDLCQKIRQLWSDFTAAISGCFSKVYQCIANTGLFGTVTPKFPIINYNLSKEALQKVYWGLGRQNKWMEAIDGRYHHLGKDVFDRGAHKGTVERGFIASMEESFTFVNNFINSKIDADWYLILHKHTCAHFNGDPNVFLMGQEKVGVFRGSDDFISCTLRGPYAVTAEAKAEFAALDQALKNEFGATYGLGEMITTGGSTRLNYKAMSRDQVRQIFNKFLSYFYQEIGVATTADQKLWAIARLQQRLEWLHPVKDGTARTSTALMNKFLTDYGFHPAILEYPHVSSSYSVAQWKQYLQNGLIKWEQERERLNPPA